MPAIGSLLFTVLVWAAVALVLLVFLYEVYVIVAKTDLIPSRSS